MTGLPDMWDQRIRISRVSDCRSYAWSPCGQFVAALSRQAVEIRDVLTSELFSTLTKPNTCLLGGLTYSLDGCSLACLSETSIVIWDIKTGGVAKEAGYSCTYNVGVSLVWSLDGGMVCAVLQGLITNTSYTVQLYNVSSGEMLSPGTFQSGGEPYLWANNGSFQIMVMRWDSEVWTVDIFEVGPVFTKVESFCIESLRQHDQIGSFSPTTYRISVLVSGQLHILDMRNSGCLLKQEGSCGPHCFSSDGSLFAASLPTGIHVWKFIFGCYTLWKEFPTQDWASFYGFSLQFSPTLLSLLGSPQGALHMWRLDGPPTIPHLGNHIPLVVFSHCGSYMATYYMHGGIITITSQASSQIIDTGMRIGILVLTGNILLVGGQKDLVAWRLTENGLVDGVSGEKKADRDDSIWIVPQLDLGWPMYNLMFTFEDQTAIINNGKHTIHIYHTGSGEIFKHTNRAPHSPSCQFSLQDLQRCQHYHHYLAWNGWTCTDIWLDSWVILLEGWVRDPEGRHRLWIPIEWRMPPPSGSWFSNTTTLYLNWNGGTVAIKL